MKPLCIAVICNDGYQEYIPFYIYYILTAYPEYEIFVYIDGDIKPEIEQSLSLIKNMGIFKIKSLSYKYNKNNDQALKSIRWILHDEEFNNYENIYIGDIDMFIVKESPSLYDSHLKHCEEINLPYSNIIRENTEKMTGLHFMKTQEYFPKALPIIEKYKNLIAQDNFNMHNENLLYNILKESIGLPLIRGNFNTHHGIHMRVFTRRRDLQTERNDTNYPFKWLFEKHYNGFYKATVTGIPSQIYEIVKNIKYSNEHKVKYNSAGMNIKNQLENVMTLCTELRKENNDQ